MGSYVFRWPYPANDVHVTGTFDDWGKTEQLVRVGDHWEKEVQLPSADEKIYYKFVVDDDWTTDKAAPQEEDGHFNVNNVLLPQDIKRKELTAGAPGAFPETPAQEEEKTYSVQPIPASSGIGNPISLAPGQKVPDQKDISSNTVGSTVTTSKEDYEKAGAGVGLAAAGAAAAGGVAAAARSAFQPSEKKENLIPESSLPSDAPAVDTLDSGPFISSAAGSNTTTAALAGAVPLERNDPTISSAAGSNTTTAALAGVVPLEQRDPTISSAAGSGTTTAALAGGVPLEQKRQAVVIEPEQIPATAVPEPVVDSIAKSNESPEAAASAEAVKEKSAVEKELLSKTTPSQAAGESVSAATGQNSYYGLATTVPSEVEQSMKQANAPPEAASEPSVVAEKAALEKELLSKVPSSEVTGEPAPTIAAATSSTAPTSSATAAAAVSDVTGGTAANQALPGTDTSTTTRGPAAGEIAGGAAVGGLAATGAATAAAHPHAATSEPARIADAQKPEVTTESTPANATQTTAPIVDNTDSSLANEPAVKLMNQQAGASATPAAGPTPAATAAALDAKSESVTATSAPALAVTTTPSTEAAGSGKVAEAAATPTTPKKDASADGNTPTSAASKKKKHRLSGWFDKLRHKNHEST